MVSAALKKTEGYVGTDTILMLDPRVIKFDPRNPRRKVGGTKEDSELKEHIRHGGHIPPLLVRKDGSDFVLVGGNRRLYAIQSLIAEGLEFASVKCELTTENDVGKLLAMAITDNEGKPLTPLEMAEAYLVIKKEGRQAKEIAEMVGKTQAHVSQMLKVAEKGTRDLKKRVESGEVRISEAYKIILELEKTESEEPETDNEGDGEQPSRTARKQAERADEIASARKANKVHQAEIAKAARATEEDEDEGLKLDADDKKIVRLLEEYDVDGLLAKACKAAKVCAKLYPQQKRKWVKASTLLGELADSLAA